MFTITNANKAEETFKCLASDAWENAKFFAIFCLFPSFLHTFPPFAAIFSYLL